MAIEIQVTLCNEEEEKISTVGSPFVVNILSSVGGQHWQVNMEKTCKMRKILITSKKLVAPQKFRLIYTAIINPSYHFVFKKQAPWELERSVLIRLKLIPLRKFFKSTFSLLFITSKLSQKDERTQIIDAAEDAAPALY